jgi:VIT1/CCC1 family predicted Fe2+/Mn2+ transporter
VVSNTALVLGVIGAGLEPAAAVATGVAGLLAGAFSMAAGEYVSVASQRELFEFQVAEEKDELSRYPAEEAEELAVIYAARGMPVDLARRTAHALVKDPAKALDALVREELGLDPGNLGSPVRAALASFGSFAIGAGLPLVPLAGGRGIEWTLAAAGTGLFVVGAVISLFSGRSALAGGLRMLGIGAAAGAATYAAGCLVGSAI